MLCRLSSEARLRLPPTIGQPVASAARRRPRASAAMRSSSPSGSASENQRGARLGARRCRNPRRPRGGSARQSPRARRTPVGNGRLGPLPSPRRGQLRLPAARGPRRRRRCPGAAARGALRTHEREQGDDLVFAHRGILPKNGGLDGAGRRYGIFSIGALRPTKHLTTLAVTRSWPRTTGAVPGQRGSGKAGLAPEPTRARAEGEALQRPQLGGPFEAATDLSQGSEPPPPFGNLPTGREDDESIPPPAPGRVDAFAEFEGAIPGESTRIDESDLLAEQSTAILDEGPRLPFSTSSRARTLAASMRSRTGRPRSVGASTTTSSSPTCPCRDAMSRVIREGATITLRDLGSGNGTQLNGRRAHVEPLVEGTGSRSARR